MKTLSNIQLEQLSAGNTVNALCAIGGGIALFVLPGFGFAFGAYCIAAMWVNDQYGGGR